MIASTTANLVGIHTGGRRTRDFTEAKQADEELYGRFFHAMLDAGVALAPGAYEVAFCGLAHDDAVIDEVVSTAEIAARRIVEER